MKKAFEYIFTVGVLAFILLRVLKIIYLIAR
jgi:hypothetical protein